MDLRTFATFLALLLVAAESRNTSTTSYLNTSTTQTTIGCSCPPTAQPASTSPPPLHLGVLSINWTGECKGQVTLARPSLPTTRVCYSSESVVQPLLGSVCGSRRGCTEPMTLQPGLRGGYNLIEGGTTEGGYEIKNRSCKSLELVCEAGADVQAQLKVFKVVTSLLFCVLLILILIRFTKPTVRALQSRLSDRRQNRWIGPTQSHSVSYYRGKSVIQNDDREKRLSYPALERLAVNDSREPSSSRNSEYNF